MPHIVIEHSGGLGVVRLASDAVAGKQRLGIVRQPGPSGARRVIPPQPAGDTAQVASGIHVAGGHVTGPTEAGLALR